MGKWASLFVTTILLPLSVLGICPDGASFWHANHCEEYYFCNNGNPILRRCPQNMYWSVLKTSCDFPHRVPDCVGGTRPPQPEVTSAEPPTTPAEWLEASNCGEVLDGQKGRISYKVDINYDARERCIWVIRTRDSSRITLNLIHANMYNVNSHISVDAFTRYNNPDDDSANGMQTRGRLSRPRDSIVVNGSVAIVYFYSYDTDNHGTGFILEFEGNEDFQTDNAPQSSDIILSGSHGSYNFPSGSGRYGNNELTTMVFLPPQQVGWSLKFNFSNIDGPALADGCTDSIRIFRALLTAGFSFRERICSDDITPDKVYEWGYPTVLVFISDHNITAAGFRLEWTIT